MCFLGLLLIGFSSKLHNSCHYPALAVKEFTNFNPF